MDTTIPARPDKVRVAPCNTCGIDLLWLNDAIEKRPLEAEPVTPRHGETGYILAIYPDGATQWRDSAELVVQPLEHLRVHRCRRRVAERAIQRVTVACISDLAVAIEAARGGQSVRVRCPAHDDHTKSLYVSPGTDHPVIMHCHAGCETADILAVAGLDWESLS